MSFNTTAIKLLPGFMALHFFYAVHAQRDSLMPEDNIALKLEGTWYLKKVSPKIQTEIGPIGYPVSYATFTSRGKFTEGDILKNGEVIIIDSGYWKFDYGQQELVFTTIAWYDTLLRNEWPFAFEDRFRASYKTDSVFCRKVLYFDPELERYFFYDPDTIVYIQSDSFSVSIYELNEKELSFAIPQRMMDGPAPVFYFRRKDP